MNVMCPLIYLKELKCISDFFLTTYMSQVDKMGGAKQFRLEYIINFKKSTDFNMITMKMSWKSVFQMSYSSLLSKKKKNVMLLSKHQPRVNYPSLMLQRLVQIYCVHNDFSFSSPINLLYDLLVQILGLYPKSQLKKKNLKNVAVLYL